MDLKKICLGCMREKLQASGKCPYCGFDTKTYEYNNRWLPLEHILAGKYLLGRVIGEGGFGITYIGWDLNMEVRVAIKEYFPVGLASREIRGTSQYTISSLTGERKQNYRHGLEKFAAEARSLAKFYHLEGIVAVKDFFFENETAYMVMEYVDGVTLKEYLKKHGERLDEKEALRIFQPVIRSLEVVHQENVIHRDISPDNIMITRSGESKLIDFGAARMSCNDQNHTFTIILKHGYAPPEQYQTKGQQGPWTDVYAVCATLYRTMTGQLPPNAMDRLNRDELKSFEEMGCPVSGKMTSAIIKRGMALQIPHRYQSMAELYDALYPENGQKQTGQCAEGKKNGMLVAGVCAAAVLGVAIVLFLVGNGKKEQQEPVSGRQAVQQNLAPNQETSSEAYTIESESTETESETQTAERKEKESEAIQIETEAAAIPEGDWYYITSTYPKGIAVRSAPTGESEQIGRIPYGTEFCVREYKGDWGYTTVNGMTGWIELSYAAMLKETKSESWYQIISTYKKGIAVRSEATGESTELCRVPYGTVFYVEKTERNWGYTTINGITGWIELSYAQAIEVSDTEPYSEKEILIN